MSDEMKSILDSTIAESLYQKEEIKKLKEDVHKLVTRLNQGYYCPVQKKISGLLYPAQYSNLIIAKSDEPKKLTREDMHSEAFIKFSDECKEVDDTFTYPACKISGNGLPCLEATCPRQTWAKVREPDPDANILYSDGGLRI